MTIPHIYSDHNDSLIISYNSFNLIYKMLCQTLNWALRHLFKLSLKIKDCHLKQTHQIRDLEIRLKNCLTV